MSRLVAVSTALLILTACATTSAPYLPVDTPDAQFETLRAGAVRVVPVAGQVSGRHTLNTRPIKTPGITISSSDISTSLAAFTAQAIQQAARPDPAEPSERILQVTVQDIRMTFNQDFTEAVIAAANSSCITHILLELDSGFRRGYRGVGNWQSSFWHSTANQGDMLALVDASLRAAVAEALKDPVIAEYVGINPPQSDR